MVAKTPNSGSFGLRVTFLGATRLTSLSKTTSGCLGLVEGRDGMGLRFKREDFAAAWKVIHPAKEMPPDLHGAALIKLQPLPFGTSKDMLSQWAMTYKCALG